MLTRNRDELLVNNIAMKKFTSLIIIVLASLISLSGQKMFTLKVTPDDFPNDITWELQGQDCRNIVLSGDLEGCLPNEECVVEETMIPDGCYTLLLRDRAKNGFQSGGYEVFFDGQLVIEGQVFEEKIYHNFNCGSGEICENAVRLTLPDNDINVPFDKEHWMSFTPEVDGFYRINSCGNAAPGVNADTRLWIYDNCDRSLQNCGAEGAIGHSDDDATCAPGAGFDFYRLDGGTTYYLRHKSFEETWINNLQNDSLDLKVQKRPAKAGCLDPTACNYDPIADVPLANSCVYDDCLPDMSLDVVALRESIIVDTVFSNDLCFIEEGCLRGEGPREVVRFTTKIDNIGDADYVVGRPEVSEKLFDNNNCHGHYHHLGYAEYLLYKGEGNPEPVGFKSGFCVLDLDCSQAPNTLPKYQCNYMGITVGCSDIYDTDIDCQWIDITEVEDGEYSIVIRINQFKLPDARGLQEKTYDNNVGQACITIDRSSGVLIVTVNEECEEYLDCQGDINGELEFDCEGNCGGNAHFGDMNDSGEVDSLDLEVYMDMLVNKMPISSPCMDLHSDGKLSIFDAALISECLVELKEEEQNPFHDHCTFPAGENKPDEISSIRISEFNQLEKYLEVEGWFPERDITGFQVVTSGIQVLSVEQLYSHDADYFMNNNTTVYAIHGEVPFARNTGYEPLVRIHFSEITADSICITSESEFINNQFDRTGLMIESGCEFVSATKEVASDVAFSIIPNPARQEISVAADGLYVEAYQILSPDGKIVKADRVMTEQSFKIKLNNLEEGLHLLHLDFGNGKSVSRRFMKIK